MPITEIDTVLNCRNSSGDTTVIYPITKADNIDGTLPITSGGTGASDAVTACANLGAAPAITYGTTNLLAGSPSEKADGAMHFVYVTKNGVWDHVKSVFITVDGVWRLVWDITYSITTNLTDVTGDSSNPTMISDNRSTNLYFTANDLYELPNEVTVVGASYDWDPETGILYLYNPTENITVTIDGVASNDCIMFAGDDGSDFTLEAAYVKWDGTIEYSTDKSTWDVWDGSAISSSDGKLYMRGSGNTTFFDVSEGEGTQLILSDNAGCYGNLNTLLEYSNPPYILTTDYCYANLFAYCTSLTHAPELPATTLSNGCYYSMFSGCESLTRAPKLPATTLSEECYNGMFNSCTSLTYAPELPATTLYPSCYQQMFLGCTNLTRAPELPATTLTTGCYQQMFYDCYSLNRAPKLPATTLDTSCYIYMFSGCTSLTQPPELPATTLASQCYYGMFGGCEGIKLSATQEGDYQTAYRIPTSGMGANASNALQHMFDSTGGTFTGTPSINTIYYGAWGT